jgi:hypothetical protein
VNTCAVTSEKFCTGISDPDIEINVEKVVFISIADKLLFKSGSWVRQTASGVLAK